MKKYAVILTYMALGLSLSFAQNDPNASQADTSAGAAIPSSSDTSATPEDDSSAGAIDQSGQAADQSAAERIVAEPAGAGLQQEVGTIKIEGTVKTAEEKQAIEDHLKTMPGVTRIDNKLTVVGDVSEPAGAETQDDSSVPEADDTDSTDSSSDTPGAPDQSSPDASSSQTP